MPTISNQLTAAYHDLPSRGRELNESFVIRIRRALSWLERAESLEKGEHEGRFISTWIGFNALYGQLDDTRSPWKDREAWRTFLAKIWRLDRDETIQKVLWKRRDSVTKLIGDKYLSADYWKDESDASAVAQAFNRATNWKQTQGYIWVEQQIYRPLFERLYIMRVQVFHGASTKGDSLNRHALPRSAAIMMDMLSAFLSIMIHQGAEEDWGHACFPPHPWDDGARRRYLRKFVERRD